MAAMMHPYLKHLCESDLSTKSKSTHLERCRMLVRACDQPLDVVLKNPHESYHKVRQKYADANTLHCILGTVLSVLKYNQEEPSFHGDSPVVKKWRALKATISQKLHDRSLDGKKSIKEQQGWVDWTTVIRRQQELGRDEYGSDRHLILSLYSLIPPARLDYNDVQIFSREPEKELTCNYLVVHSPNSMDLYLNSYKTAAKYGMYKKHLPLALCNVINYSLEKAPRQYLISQKRDRTKPMANKSTFQKYLSSILKTVFNKPVTVNILRHSFISSIDYNSNTPRDLLAYAKDMHHSIEQQLFYRRYPASDQSTKDLSVVQDKTLQPAQPVQPVQPAQPVQPVQPAQPAQPMAQPQPKPKPQPKPQPNPQPKPQPKPQRERRQSSFRPEKYVIL